MFEKFNKNTLGILSNQMNFNRDTLEKVVRLIDVLDFINSTSLLKSNLSLKGGTAINLTVFNLPRLSVDIDLDFTSNLPKENMLTSRESIKECIIKYMKSIGYELSQKSKYHYALDSLVFTYKNSGNTNDNLKIEINYLIRNHILPIKEKTYIFNNEKHYVMANDKIEIFASKVVALLTRTAPRDLYDIYNMIKKEIISQDQIDIFRKCIVFYNILNGNTSTEYDLSTINKLKSFEIKTKLLPVIHKSEFFDLKIAQETVCSYLSNILSLQEEEKLFIQNFSNNNFMPHLLFGDTETSKNLLNHPMIQWKLNNQNI